MEQLSTIGYEKLKQPQIAKYREEVLEKQGGKCAFCGQDCKKNIYKFITKP